MMDTTYCAANRLSQVNRTANRIARGEPSRLESVSAYSPQFDLDQLTGQLTNQLRFVQTNPGGRTNSRVLDAYNAADAQVQQWREEAQTFLRTIIDSATTLEKFDADLANSKPRDDAQQAVRDLLDEFYSFRFSLPASVKTLHFLAQPPDVLYPILRTHVLDSVNDFTSDLHGVLKAMADRGVVGSVAFAGKSRDNCEFTHFHSNVINRNTSDSTTAKFARWEYPPVRIPIWWKKKYSTITRIRSGRFTIQHVCSKTLMNEVRVTPLRRWRPSVPERIAALFSAIPWYLKAYSDIITGRFQQAQIVAKDVADVPWTYTKQHERVERQVHYDPCVLIGPWVVGAWCDEEPTMPRHLWVRARRQLAR